tara:strand:- start:1642 stop:2175 length:534 start_codon:yes stop_codon:yes gene_type:complete
MFKSINIIVCCDNKNGIGIDNNLPWNIKSEMKIFRQKTIGNGNNCVIMGKNTYNSIPLKYRPLKDRVNYVVSTTMKEEKSIFILENLENDLINMIKNTNYDTYWIIGGEHIYKYFMEEHISLVNEIHITIIKKDYECNKFFPVIDKNLFKLIKTNEHIEDKYSQCIYKSINHNTDCL